MNAFLYSPNTGKILQKWDVWSLVEESAVQDCLAFDKIQLNSVKVYFQVEYPRRPGIATTTDLRINLQSELDAAVLK